MTSPFASRLGSNYCPTDEEVPQICALLVDPSSRLKQLDNEIADLQKTIDKLAERRASLGAFVDAHRALLSPIRRLPLDVIEEIFVACLPTHRNCVMSASEAPVLLGRICSSWRAISLTTTRLWTRLHVVWPARLSHVDVIDAKVAQRLEVFETWFGRSGQLPLSISVYGIAPSFLQALLPFVSRLQHIHFMALPPSLEPLSHITEADVPMLETIAVTHLPRRDEGWESSAMFRGPRISGFTAPAVSFATGNLPLRWHQLTILKMERSGGDILSQKVLKLLSGCPELRICKLFASHSDGAPHPPVELKFLHTLQLAPRMGGAALTFLLDRLTLPELRNLSLAVQIADQQNLPGYLTRWTKLESLEISNRSFSASSWVECICSLPATMRRLRIADTMPIMLYPPALETALTVLAPPYGTPLPCPALEELHISSTSTLSDDALLRFITGRMVAVFPPTLRHVEVKFQRSMEADILPDIQPFINGGLRVSLTYSRPFRLQSSPSQGLPDGPPEYPQWSDDDDLP
ncbi:hypothetical protein C8F04DRAFT_1388707 [Mycena alexandri]|uniref:F-box domain-containing protein n=1 Tax=Mycena alexandri TaxID=1745969 RepID=A0AAD6TEM2_9AGAR|nr:hypothetical protein C8F04DRAFT_1388707 [Mycena alexandri]